MHTFVVKLHLWLLRPRSQCPCVSFLLIWGTGPSGPSDENLRNYIRRCRSGEVKRTKREWRETRQSCFGNKTSCRASSLEPPAWATTFLRAASGPSELYPPEREGGKKATIRTFDTCWLTDCTSLAAKTQKKLFKKKYRGKDSGSVFRWGRLLSKVKVSGLKCKTHTHTHTQDELPVFQGCGDMLLQVHEEKTWIRPIKCENSWQNMAKH